MMQKTARPIRLKQSGCWKTSGVLILGLCLSGAASATNNCKDSFAGEGGSSPQEVSMEEAIFQYKSLLYAVSKMRQTVGSNPTTIAAFEADLAKRKSQLIARGVDVRKLILTAQDRSALSKSEQIQTTKQNQAAEDKKIQTQSILDDPHMGDWVPGRVLFESTDSILNVMYSPKGTFVALELSNGSGNVVETGTGQIVMDSLSSPDFDPSDAEIFAFSKDDRYLLVSQIFGYVWIFDLNSRKLVNEFKTHARVLNSISLTPDNRLAILTHDKIHMRDFSISKKPWYWPFTRIRTERLTSPGISYKASSISPSGNVLGIAHSNQSLEFRNLKSKKVITTPNAHTSDITSLVFSLDSTKVGTSSEDLTARIWDVESGRLIQTLKGHVGHVRSIDFSPDGLFAVTGSADGTARIWRISNGEQLHKLEGHKGWVNSVKFSQDGKKVLTGSSDGLLREWDYKVADL